MTTARERFLANAETGETKETSRNSKNGKNGDKDENLGKNFARVPCI